MSFLKDVISTAILRTLGKYIQHFQQDQVLVGLWAGDLVLEDVELNVSAINSYTSSLRIARGYIGRTHINVPWRSFWRTPIHIDISGVDVELHLQGEYDIQAEIDAKNQAVEELLALAKASVQTGGLLGGLSSSLLHRIVNNILIEIDDVNVYHTLAPYTVGLTLASLRIHDVQSHKTLIKEMELHALTLYSTVHGGAPREIMAPIDISLTLDKKKDMTIYCSLDKSLSIHIPANLTDYLTRFHELHTRFCAGKEYSFAVWNYFIDV
ncbi:hypothetical protein Ae201684P_019918 [Aphanomyces euteiches]|nr:hypothetical protein Ae201684P_019918 [Aphanomyces euteiches]KAH9144571.1 hypothetical protein AeRB84_011490 [Aphanomyces euteiches]